MKGNNLVDKWQISSQQLANKFVNCQLTNYQQLADSFPNLSQCSANNNVFGVFFFLRQIASSKLS